MTPVIVAVLLISSLIVLYVAAYLINRRVPKPAGCENLQADCGRCPIEHCPLRKKGE